MLERNRVAELRELLVKRATAESIAFNHQPRELHRDCAGAAPAAITELINEGGQTARRIETEVPPETVIFGSNNRAHQRRRNRVQRSPFELAPRHVHTQALQRLSVAREQRRLGAQRARAKLV